MAIKYQWYPFALWATVATVQAATTTTTTTTTTTIAPSLTAKSSSSSIAPQASTTSASSTVGNYPPQSSPAWLSDVKPLPGNIQAYPANDSAIPTGPFSTSPISLQGYPQTWKSPPIDSPQVKAAINAIDWAKVPNITVRKAKSDGSVDMAGYDQSDPDCWWSATGCTEPKRKDVPADVKNCPQVGDWGLTYDDGPLGTDAGQWAEPHLYDFLAQRKQKAALFFIGSNVFSNPAAAQRALADGHTICVHTWSHPAMTSQTNEQVVAEFYWTLHAIKEVLGITTKCWRPPYGDVDDRVRAIAWQMGMTTILWDYDSNDWNMPGSGGGKLPPSTVDGYFEDWIAARKNGSDTATGHITLQHELNNATVAMAEKWLPQVQQAFRVVPWNQCMNVAQPYWETNFVYPTNNNVTVAKPSTTSSPTPASTSLRNAVTPSAGSTKQPNSATFTKHNPVTIVSGSILIWIISNML
ncbi:hypothetical protein EC973_001227 [Apophysomyces ossiformis]|uniref:NodB homology domain-containing protein n=1 Tax=Apophysomyces ossiformis TaxID=679940 RepID=A0A8H7ES16_9FUNG|nr:hypothetical protein EC973_001227 [Apophysomyces ossiformis]